jgi:hypothetical protein
VENQNGVSEALEAKVQPTNPPNWTRPFLTLHGQVRLRQRGITARTVATVLEHHDLAMEAGNGCNALSISHLALAGLAHDGVPPSLLERARRVVVVQSANGMVVTVINRTTWFARFHRGAERLSPRGQAMLQLRSQRGRSGRRGVR